MSDANELAMLQDAWKRRQILWNEGTRLIEEGNELWKEITTMPGSTRVGIWLNISEMSKEAAQKVFHGYAKRSEADGIWHDAIVELKGPKTKLHWAFDANRKGYICTLTESGEVFEP